MKDFEIGIIGGTGGIGGWFAEYFAAAGHAVHRTGRTRGMSIPELTKRCPVVIVAVPIAATLEVIDAVGPHLPEGALLMDLTSLKEEPVRAMVAATRAEVVGCHPLFGPDCPSLAGQNICLCPGRGERWLARMEGLFRAGGARVTVTTAAEHDRMMALVQGLTHLDTILMGLALRDSGMEPAALEPFSTPVFRTKQAIVEKVFSLRPEMYAAILAGNPALPEIIARYEENLARLKELIMKHDAGGLAGLLKNP
ncbi:MAG: prephenate dehydrogenase/arogenate dehydrogenase family protein [Syntrophales bacterium]